MNYTLKQIEVFTCVAETLNMAVAAQQLHMTAPAVHKHISNLETLCNVKLFNVVSRRLMLTKHGKTLYQATQSILTDAKVLNETISSLASAPVQPISIAIHNTFAPVLYKTIHSFLREHPLTKLQLYAPNWKAIHSNIKQYDYDLIILGEPQINSRTGFNVIKISQFKLCLVASRINPISRQSINADILKNTQFLTGTSDSRLQHLQNKLFKKLKITCQPYTFDSFASIYQAVRANMGIAFLPDILIADDVAKGDLVKLSCDAKFPLTSIVGITRKNKALNEATQMLLTYLTENLDKKVTPV